MYVCIVLERGDRDIAEEKPRMEGREAVIKASIGYFPGWRKTWMFWMSSVNGQALLIWFLLHPSFGIGSGRGPSWFCVVNQRPLWVSLPWAPTTSSWLCWSWPPSQGPLFSWLPEYCVSCFPSSYRDSFFLCPSLTYWVLWIPALGPAPSNLPALPLVTLPLSWPPSLQPSQDSLPGSSTLSLSWAADLAVLLVICITGFHGPASDSVRVPHTSACDCAWPPTSLSSPVARHRAGLCLYPCVESGPSQIFLLIDHDFFSTSLNSLDSVTPSPLPASLGQASQLVPLPLFSSPILSQSRQQSGIIIPKFNSDHTLPL